MKLQTTLFLAIPNMLPKFIFLSNSNYLKQHILNHGYFIWDKNQFDDLNSVEDSCDIPSENKLRKSYISTNKYVYDSIQSNKIDSGYFINLNKKHSMHKLNNDLHTLDLFNRNYKTCFNLIHQVKESPPHNFVRIQQVKKSVVYDRIYDYIYLDSLTKYNIEDNQLLEENRVKEYVDTIEYYDYLLSNILQDKSIELILFINDLKL